MSTTPDTSNAAFGRLQTVAIALLVVGVVLLATSLASPDKGRTLWPAYLIGWLLWTGITVGSLGILMLHHMVGGGWGYVIRRFLETSSTMAPVMFLLAIPMLVPGVFDHLYEWANHDVSHSTIVQNKQAYLNTPFFMGRFVAYFAVWSIAAFMLKRYSDASDKGNGPEYAHKFKVISAPGILVHSLLVTFFSVDFIMSLEPEWYSSIFGLLTLVGQSLSTLAFCAIMLNLFKDRPEIAEFVQKKHFHDIGNLCLAFVMLWAYMSYSQYMLSWAANLPEEAKWYLHRLDGGWTPVAWSLTILHFFFPFFLLLSRQVKRTPRALATVAIAILVMRVYDLFWIVIPVFHKSKFDLQWYDFAAVVGGPLAIGGLWLAIFGYRLKGLRLVPVYPSFMEVPVIKGEEAVHHG